MRSSTACGRGDRYRADVASDEATCIDLSGQRWPDVRPGLTLLVPLGSTEQHGPHLPLDTDTVIATEVANRAAARHGGAVMVAPALPYGASGEHAGFPGTLSIGTSALTSVRVELGRSSTLPNGGPFARLVFVNGHGGNHTAVADALVTLLAEGRNVTAWWPRIPGGDAHAGHTETSLLLAIAPERVRLPDGDRRTDALRGNTEPLSSLLAAMRSGGVRAVSPSGILGDATTADAREGERMLLDLVGQLVSFLGLPTG